MANATDVTTYLANDLLNDSAHGIWGTSLLQDAIHHNAKPFITELAALTGAVWSSGRGFWLGYGTAYDQTAVLSVSVDGSTVGTMASAYVNTNAAGTVFTVDPIRGEVTFSTTYGTVAAETDVVATYYAVNLWKVAQQHLVQYQQGTAVTGEKKSIRLGPLSKSVSGPTEMVSSIEGRISSFSRFAASWETSQVPMIFSRE